MPDLMNALLGAGRTVGAYFIQDCWIGIESVEHFDEALRELSRVPQEALPVTGQ